jgi:hypothetical protein
MRPFVPLAATMLLILATPVLAAPGQSADKAAHVVQQQGGVGSTGDAHETHADRAAPIGVNEPGVNRAAPISVNEPGLPATPSDRTRQGMTAPSSGPGVQPQANDGRGRCQFGKCWTTSTTASASEVIADQTPAAPQPRR